MPRPIAYSAKQKREQLQDKRAVKRGELDPSEVRYARNPAGNYRATANHLPNPTIGPTLANRLHSRFIALTPDYLHRTRDLAHSSKLVRPLRDEAAVFPLEWMTRDGGRLTCPARPRFKSGQTKEEVEMNEETMFRQWVRDTRGFVENWVDEVRDNTDEVDDDEGVGESVQAAEEGQAKRELRSPTWFETNLEVWRQLWRVTESSHILLLLADSRCPPLHLPTSLRTYVQALQPHKEVILVLNKSDLVEPEALEGWRKWVKEWWIKGHDADGASDKSSSGNEIQVISIQSFDEDSLKPKHAPDLSLTSHRQLLEALQVAHDRLINHHQSNSSSTEEADELYPLIQPPRADINWDELAKEDILPCYLPTEPNNIQLSASESIQSGSHPLTIGLIGQPNVGKSSLLNAILGMTRVKAGRTPGKTMFWGEKKQVRFVDCPGLVCPSLVGSEIQALCGVLPISQLPSLPACILSVAQLLPIEEIFNIPPPIASVSKDEYADKRTWRTPRPSSPPRKDTRSEPKWTAWNVMEGRAIDKGYLTAKTGRPDITRAATGMMLALAEGKIRWGFQPPGLMSDRRGKGIWLSDRIEEEVSSDSGSSSAKISGNNDLEEDNLDNKFVDKLKIDAETDCN